MFTGAGAEIYYMVGSKYRLPVMLYYYNSVSGVSELSECSNKARVIPLMESDLRFIKNIKDAYQLGSDLRSEPYSLSFPSGKSAGRPVEGKIIESDIFKKIKP